MVSWQMVGLYDGDDCCHPPLLLLPLLLVCNLKTTSWKIWIWTLLRLELKCCQMKAAFVCPPIYIKTYCQCHWHSEILSIFTQETFSCIQMEYWADVTSAVDPVNPPFHLLQNFALQLCHTLVLSAVHMSNTKGYHIMVYQHSMQIPDSLASMILMETLTHIYSCYDWNLLNWSWTAGLHQIWFQLQKHHQWYSSLRSSSDQTQSESERNRLGWRWDLNCLRADINNFFIKHTEWYLTWIVEGREHVLPEFLDCRQHFLGNLRQTDSLILQALQGRLNMPVNQ